MRPNSIEPSWVSGLEFCQIINYALWRADRVPSGGFSKVKRVRHGGTLAVFQVNDIDRYLKKAKKLGGRVYRKKSALPATWATTEPSETPSVTSSGYGAATKLRASKIYYCDCLALQ